ncbi:MAG TPA: helix-turn-helix transcriptional regulator [Candidatus Tumulicola sp.]
MTPPDLLAPDAIVDEPSDAVEREALRARARVALKLAVGRHLDDTSAALAQLAAIIDPGDDEMMARYYVAKAVAQLKERALDETWQSFECALERSRAFGEMGLLAGVLTNYGMALVQDGRAERAVEVLEERLALSHALARPPAIGLLGLAEALLAAGELRRAGALLHELYTEHRTETTTMLGAATAGMSVAALLDDRPLFRLSYDPSLIDLAFARAEQWLIGPLVEGFCAYYESQDMRVEHDALLSRAVASLGSLDNSMLLGVRIARFCDPMHVSVAQGLMDRYCDAPSAILNGYRDLFESCLVERSGKRSLSTQLALRAEQSFSSAGRPGLQAVALDAAGLPERAASLLRPYGAVAYAGRRWGGKPLHRSSAQLTRRELEVAGLIARGQTNRAIAASLGISERTVHRHCESIFAKLGVYSRKQIEL